MIKIIDTIDVSEIQHEIDACDPQAWFDNLLWSAPADLDASNIGSYSKKVRHSVIREQDRILLIWHRDHQGQPWYQHSDYRTFPTVETTRSALFPNTMTMLRDYFSRRGQIIVRLYFSRLRPGRQIYPHSDERFQPQGVDFSQVRRFGLCVTTNPVCRVICGDDDHHLDPGCLYYLDNMMLHSATNPGSTDRVHMYMDIIPKSGTSPLL